MRLFAALPLDSAARDRLLRLRLRLSTPKDGLRWSVPEQWHLTLLFFGDVSPEQGDALRAGFADLHSPAPEVRIEQLGTFAQKGILHAEVQPTPTLLQLQRKIATLHQRLGVSMESRTFRPHITLARSKGKLGNTSLHKLSTPELPSLGAPLVWFAPECLLLRSVLQAGGAQYTVEARKTLTAPP